MHATILKNLTVTYMTLLLNILKNIFETQNNIGAP